MNRISNYDDLVAERRRVEVMIADRKQLINDRVEDIKERVAPLLYVLNIFKKKESGNGSTSILKMGSSLAIDLLIGQKLLGKASWLAKLVVPPLLKAVSSQVIERVRKD